jgi:hypothetical protein
VRLYLFPATPDFPSERAYALTVGRRIVGAVEWMGKSGRWHWIAYQTKDGGALAGWCGTLRGAASAMLVTLRELEVAP